MDQLTLCWYVRIGVYSCADLFVQILRQLFHQKRERWKGTTFFPNKPCSICCDFLGHLIHNTALCPILLAHILTILRSAFRSVILLNVVDETQYQTDREQQAMSAWRNLSETIYRNTNSPVCRWLIFDTHKTTVGPIYKFNHLLLKGFSFVFRSMCKMTTPFEVVLEMMVITDSAASSFLPTNRTAATMAGKQDASRSVNGLHIRLPDKLTDKRSCFYWPVFYVLWTWAEWISRVRNARANRNRAFS